MRLFQKAKFLINPKDMLDICFIELEDSLTALSILNSQQFLFLRNTPCYFPAHDSSLKVLQKQINLSRNGFSQKF